MAQVIELMVVDSPQAYQEALVRLDVIFDADPNTTEGYEARMLTKAIMDHEAAMEQPLEGDPVDVIRHIMREHNLKQSDIVPYIGSKSVVSEILSRKRPLTLNMIRNLSAALHIPVAALI